MTARTPTEWRSLILRLLGRDHELERPAFDWVLRCDPMHPYDNHRNEETTELLGPAWPLGRDLCDIRGVVVTSEEYRRLYRRPPELFAPDQPETPSEDSA